MTASDFVWENLSWRKAFVGRAVVDALVREAMHTPIEAGPVGEAQAATEITNRLRRDGSLGLIVLSYLLPYLAAEVVKLVLRWLNDQTPPVGGGPAYRAMIEG